MNVDLKSLSRKDLLKLKDDVDKAIVAAEARELKEAKKAAEMAAAEYGFSLNELVGPGTAPRAGAKSVSMPKYRDPKDASNTWTGKGRQPVWYKEAIADGVSPEDMEI